MSDYANTPREMEWDDEISSAGSSYVILEDGDYEFTVTAVERGRYPGSPKIPACKMLTATLTVETSAGNANIKYDMPWYTTMQWKIANLFCAVGLADRREKTFRPRVNEIVGSKGRAHIKVSTYQKKDGSGEGKSNDIDKFYDYDPDAVKPPEQQVLFKPDESRSPTPWDTGVF